jgi:hypothetical protein
MKSHDGSVTQNVGEIRDQEIVYFLFEPTELSVSKGSVKKHDCCLGIFKSVCSLGSTNHTSYHKTLRKKICSDFLSCYDADGEGFITACRH